MNLVVEQVPRTLTERAGGVSRPAFVTKVLTYYAQYVFPSRLRPGEFDPAILSQVQNSYVEKKVVRGAQPVESLYTNQSIPGGM